jgi:hypothetical protein
MSAPARLSRHEAAVLLMDMSEDERKTFAERVAARASELHAESVKSALAEALRQAFAEIAAARQASA